MNFLAKSNGFSLIEVLIALIILAISLLALAGLMATSVRNNSFGGRMTEAATFAQDKLEELRAVPWGALIPGTDQKEGCTGINYGRNWTVDPDPWLNPNAPLRKIGITVSWSDRGNHSIKLLSVISNPE